MQKSLPLEPVPEINEISQILSEQYDAPHITLYYEAGLSEPEEEGGYFTYRNLSPAEGRAAIEGFVAFLKGSLQEFARGPDKRLSAKVKLYLETLPTTVSTLQAFAAQATQIRQQLPAEPTGFDEMTTYYLNVGGKWFYFSFGHLERHED